MYKVALVLLVVLHCARWSWWKLLAREASDFSGYLKSESAADVAQKAICADEYSPIFSQDKSVAEIWEGAVEAVDNPRTLGDFANEGYGRMDRIEGQSGPEGFVTPRAWAKGLAEYDLQAARSAAGGLVD
ncbi:hypothetical protein OBBRIDRAFT_801542 [Obba rivulosa]|uniref:Uncharacterized protein n=1 Tax=Obba rivulosa TaxID=1052685 RepID=A0A8E2DQY4_9APHY|nr:hypothetical protein OBBRIDRAFT_801542 [Obba rivulosa]